MGRTAHFETARLLLHALSLLCVLLLCACAIGPATKAHGDAGNAPAPWPYVGFVLGQTAEGEAIVVDVIAGPAALAGLRPGDRIETMAGEKTTAAQLLDRLRASTPGTRIPLHVIREEKALDLVLVIGDHAQWATPLAFPSRVPHVRTPARNERVWLDDVEDRVAAAAPELAQDNARLGRMFEDLANEDDGYNRLPLTRLALADPGALIEQERNLVRDMQPVALARTRIVPNFCKLLAIDCGSEHGAGEQNREPRSMAEFTASIASANRRVREAFAGAEPRAQLYGDLRYLMHETATQRTLIDQPDALRGIRAMQASMHVDFAALLDAFDNLIANAMRAPQAPATARRQVPPALRAMVEGEILDYAEVDGGYVVIGGPGPNRYRMDRLYAVIDVGGNDTYTWGEGVPLETQTIVDLAGNDRYEAGTGGPGAGWLGASVLFDLDGDDNYASALGGCGAGAFGFGLLFDAAGTDTYRCDAWSIGAGIYGGGALIDAGDGWDTYLSQSLSQGVGGPAGVGLLIDEGGDDLYRANGPVPSTYDTPTTYMSFSQGVGFGIRPYDHGGIGALIDYAGNDRYEGGEFSQGGGYFWAVGFLHDAGGNDFYYGGRYTQGFAAHQAAGLLTDMSGDDVYWGMRAAAQGAAWDQSIAMLYDGSGNDFYRAESLAQGAAAQQSKAWLYDVSGNDVYRHYGPAGQGDAGDNSYHFRPEDPIFSLGVLVDGGGEDRYSSGLANGETRVRHVVDLPEGGRGNAGVAIDILP